MVFIDGPCNLMPWHEKAKDVMILVNNCLKTKKILFVS